MNSPNPCPEQTLLFLDVEGVLSVVARDAQEVTLNKQGFSIYPVPSARQFLQALDSAHWIKVMWISSHGKESQLINDWARTQRWPSAYPLPLIPGIRAHCKFADSRDAGKLLSVRWYSRQWAKRIVWIEDGFSAQTHTWASEDKRVQLIDTRPTAYAGTKRHWPNGIQEWNIKSICKALALDSFSIEPF